MTLLDAYPLVTTPDLAAVRGFWTAHFEAAVVFDSSWFLMLGVPGAGGRGHTLAYMTPDHPSRPPGPEAFDGKGLILTLQVESAAATHDRLAASGADIVYALAREPWGQVRFMLRDPADLLIDVVEQVEPAAGFWERFEVRAGL